jgi:hypothetical protein
VTRVEVVREPGGRFHEPFREQVNIEAQPCRMRVDCVFVRRQQVN